MTLYSTAPTFADDVLELAADDQRPLLKMFVDKYVKALNSAQAVAATPVNYREVATEQWHRSDDPAAAADKAKRDQIAEKRAQLQAAEDELNARAKEAIDAIVQQLKEAAKTDEAKTAKKTLNDSAKALIGALEVFGINDVEVAGNLTEATNQASSSRSAEIREWARENGYDVSDKGRIAEDVVEAFEKANA